MWILRAGAQSQGLQASPASGVAAQASPAIGKAESLGEAQISLRERGVKTHRRGEDTSWSPRAAWGLEQEWLGLDTSVPSYLPGLGSSTEMWDSTALE